MERPVQRYKLAFVGDERVGKTCLINRIVYNTFDTNYIPTIGIDFLSKTI